jgi:hypothetical protein
VGNLSFSGGGGSASINVGSLVVNKTEEEADEECAKGIILIGHVVGPGVFFELEEGGVLPESFEDALHCGI